MEYVVYRHGETVFVGSCSVSFFRKHILENYALKLVNREHGEETYRNRSGITVLARELECTCKCCSQQ